MATITVNLFMSTYRSLRNNDNVFTNDYTELVGQMLIYSIRQQVRRDNAPRATGGARYWQVMLVH